MRFAKSTTVLLTSIVVSAAQAQITPTINWIESGVKAPWMRFHPDGFLTHASQIEGQTTLDYSIRDADGNHVNSASEVSVFTGIATRDRTVYFGIDQLDIKQYSLADASFLSTHAHGLPISTPVVSAVSDDNKYLAVGVVQGPFRVSVFDTSGPSEVRRLHWGPLFGEVAGVQIQNSGLLSVSTSLGNVILYDIFQGRVLKVCSSEAGVPVKAHRVSPNGQFVYGVGRDGIVRVWRTRDGGSPIAHWLPPINGEAMSDYTGDQEHPMAMTSDGRMIATYLRGTSGPDDLGEVVLYRASDGAVVQRFIAPGQLLSMALRDDMRYLAVADLEIEGVPGLYEYIFKLGVWRTHAEFLSAPPRFTATIQSTNLPKDRIPLTVEIRSGGFVLERHLVEPNAAGEFEISTSQSGVVDVWVKASNWLADKKSVDLGSGDPVAFTLVNGDVDGNNSVNVADFLQLRQSFGASGYLYDVAADLNGDGSVGIADFLILRSNFGRTGSP